MFYRKTKINVNILFFIPGPSKQTLNTYSMPGLAPLLYFKKYAHAIERYYTYTTEENAKRDAVRLELQ